MIGTETRAGTCNHIGEMLREQQQRRPGASAVHALEGPPTTYARLAAQAERTRELLASFGIAADDTVALVLPDGPQAAVAFLTIAAVATTAPLNPAYRPAELAFYLEDLRARAVVVPAGGGADARAVARERGIQILELVPDETAAGLFTLNGERSAAGTCAASSGSPEAVALVLHTSGTTARPKIVPLTHANLCRSARNTADALSLGPDDRCLNVMPLFHVHGLISALLSTISAGGSIVCTPGFQAPSFLKWLEDFRITWYTAVPTMHQAIAQRAAALPPPLDTWLRLIRSSSAALPPPLMTELERLFNVPVLESYGMTEGSQISSNPLPPRRRKPGSAGLPTGPEVAVLAEDGAPLGPGRLGEIAIRGSNVTPGYRDPRANESAFVHGWFRTGDQGYRDEEGYIFLTGRFKELINRAGEKLAPREIDEALLSHPEVAQAVTFGLPDARLGESVAAAVVLRPGAQVTERQLREFLTIRLAFFKVPARIVFVEELPKGPTGKLQRLGLGERLGLSTDAPAAPEHMADLDAPVERVIELAAEVLGVPSVDPAVSFLEAGGDSILGAQLVARLREAFSVEVNLFDVFDARSFASLASTVAEQVLSAIESMPNDAAVI